MRRRKTKRSISMFMALILVLGMIVTTLPAGLFSTTLEAAVSYNPGFVLCRQMRIQISSS